MKAERRHELKENDLAHMLSVARAYLDAHGTRVGFLVVVLAIVVAAVAFGVRSRAAAVEDVWRRRSQLRFDDPEVGRESLEALASMTRGLSDDRFVLASLIDQGVQGLRLAQEVPVPPDRTLNETARGAFEQLLARFSDNPLAVGVARSGLATVEQNFFVLDGDPVHKQRAAAHLAAIIEDPALNGMPFKRMALERRETLDETFVRMTFAQPELPPEEPAGETAPQPSFSIEIVEPAVDPADEADAAPVTPSTPPAGVPP